MEPDTEPRYLSALTEEQAARLVNVLEVLEKDIKRQNSLKRTFIKGAVYGLGTVVGGAILVALFGGLIATTVNLLSGEPILNENLETNR